MSRLTRRQQGKAAGPRGVAVVQTWGPEPIGAADARVLDTVAARNISGMTWPNPAGWGLQGSQELTDAHVWAGPQAFTGSSPDALAALALPGARPTIYPADPAADGGLTGVVLPGPGGV